MLKKILSATLFNILLVSTQTQAANLLQVYRDALKNDPTYQQAIAQELSDSEGVSISLANLLPNAAIDITPSISRSLASGSANQVFFPGSTGKSTSKGYQLNLSITQTIFDWGKFENLSSAKEIAKQAKAALNASLQDLMIRVSKAYLAILEDKDNLYSAAATREAYAKQLEQVSAQHKVGLKKITDVYTARASYENSRAAYIAAENTLSNDKENLRAITGYAYPVIGMLSKRFPLTTPNPLNVEAWVKITEKQNWSIKAAQYAKAASLATMKQEMAGHFPTLNFEASYNDAVSNNSGNSALTVKGSSQIHTTTGSLVLAIPIYSGGGVVAGTNQAKYNYQVSSQKLEKQIRSFSNLARQSYLSILLGINKIKADIQTIQSLESSLEGMQESYKIGTETLINILNQREKVYLAQRRYATDRYAFVLDLLLLKQAAGTLSEQDLIAINSWIVNV